MSEKIPLRIVVRELHFMPTAYRWAVDFCENRDQLEVDGDYIMALSKFFESEDLAQAHANKEAIRLGFPKADDRTWKAP